MKEAKTGVGCDGFDAQRKKREKNRGFFGEGRAELARKESVHQCRGTIALRPVQVVDVESARSAKWQQKYRLPLAICKTGMEAQELLRIVGLSEVTKIYPPLN